MGLIVNKNYRRKVENSKLGLSEPHRRKIVLGTVGQMIACHQYSHNSGL